jgi:multidrug transporter EmrE-like cation transporter
MQELINELVDKWVILYAIVAVAFTEALMRRYDKKLTRWQYAIPITFCVTIVLSLIHSFKQPEVLWHYGITRGVKSGIVAIAGYDVFKATVLNIPFLNKKLIKADREAGGSENG